MFNRTADDVKPIFVDTFYA